MNMNEKEAVHAAVSVDLLNEIYDKKARNRLTWHNHYYRTI